MSNHKVIYQESQMWKGKQYITEYIDSIDFNSIKPITQVQALCIDELGRYIVYQDNEGNYGLPGGTVEDESLEEALRREIEEEVSCKILNFRPLLYLRNTNPPDDPISVTYQVRYVAKVVPFSDQVNDPAGKAVRRVVIENSTKLHELLQWGHKLNIYLNAARNSYE